MIPDFFKEESEFSRVEALLWYGCAKLMKAGGGSISGDHEARKTKPTALTEFNKQLIRDLALGGKMSAKQIATETKLPDSTVRNYLYRCNIVVRDGRRAA